MTYARKAEKGDPVSVTYLGSEWALNAAKRWDDFGVDVWWSTRTVGVGRETLVPVKIAIYLREQAAVRLEWSDDEAGYSLCRLGPDGFQVDDLLPRRLEEAMDLLMQARTKPGPTPPARADTSDKYRTAVVQARSSDPSSVPTQTAVAYALGISDRQLRRRIKRHKLPWPPPEDWKS